MGGVWMGGTGSVVAGFKNMGFMRSAVLLYQVFPYILFSITAKYNFNPFVGELKNIAKIIGFAFFISCFDNGGCWRKNFNAMTTSHPWRVLVPICANMTTTERMYFRR